MNLDYLNNRKDLNNGKEYFIINHIKEGKEIKIKCLEKQKIKIDINLNIIQR